MEPSLKKQYLKFVATKTTAQKFTVISNWFNRIEYSEILCNLCV